jgi:phosphoglycerate dehydrogenase-like enzyme
VTRIAVLDDYQSVAREFADWSAVPGPVEVVEFHDHVAEPHALVARLEPFDVVVAMRERTPFTAQRLARLPRLRLLVTTGMGNAAIDMEAARAQGVTVAGTGGVGSGTAELTWGLILAVARHIPAEDAAMRAGEWQRTVGRDLAGRILGVIGLGTQGAQVARFGRAFGMRVLTWSAHMTPERAAEHGAEAAELDDLLRAADVVTVHVRLNAGTRGLIGARELALMRPDALLVNTSRGPVIEEAALVEALRAGTIGGAALDVYDVEPLPPGHPLLAAPNTVLTPHIGYVTRDTYAVFFADALEDVAAWLHGAPVRVLAAP